MRFGPPRSDRLPVNRRRLLRGVMLALPVSLVLWAMIGATAIHVLPAHSRHAISWRLHAFAAHMVAHYRDAAGGQRQALA